MRKQLSGIGKAFGIVWDADKIYPFLLLMRALAASVIPLYSSVCVSRLISGLAGERRIDSIILILILLLSGILLLRALEAHLEWQCSYRYMRMQDVFTAKNSMKAMKMEYPATESSEVADLYVNAWRANMSPGAILKQAFSVFGGAVQILGCVGIILHLGSILLGIVVVFIMLYCFLDYRMSARRRKKTTFVKLLLGLYRPTKGEILLNGVNIDRYSDEEYRKIFAPVFQDYQLFAYTIRENLVFDGEYHKAGAETLLAELGLDKKIGSLPDGVEQYVGKGYEKSGVDFSGGEKQKIAIARALLKDSVCVVLDEPTAALDPIAEMELYRQINGLAGEKSCVFITHRLAGVRFSSRILYFENGRIAEQGSCQKLLEKEGKFYEFYQLQAQMYLNESM